MLERKDAITNEVLEPVTFTLGYPTAFKYVNTVLEMLDNFVCYIVLSGTTTKGSKPCKTKHHHILHFLLVQ
jgi:hypothetical protein